MKRDPALTTAIMLTHYGFDLNGGSLPLLIEEWLSAYPNKWVLAAVVEALYQGRYKANSVNRILNTWCSRGEALPSFDHDFADYFCKKIIRALLVQMEVSKEFDDSQRPSEPQAMSAPIKNAQPVVVKKHVPNPRISDHLRLASRL